MPWLIGIDEAGYGPNLGPLVQSAVGVRVEGDASDCDLWQRLRKAVCKQNGKKNGRLVIDDSKKVYGPTQDVANLELGVLGALGHDWPATVGELLAQIAPPSLLELQAEPWFMPSQPLPVAVDSQVARAQQERFRNSCTSAEVGSFFVRSRVTPAPLFNTLLEELNNKSNVLLHGLTWLLRETNNPAADGEPVACVVDRQGGKKFHSALIQHVCPDGFAEVVAENDRCSAYRMNGTRERRWSFEVEADSRHFTVALASMVSKYLREVLMGQFNRFWQSHVPGLEPTAGYPGDAARFFDAIGPAMAKLGMEKRLIWRQR